MDPETREALLDRLMADWQEAKHGGLRDTLELAVDGTLAMLEEQLDAEVAGDAAPVPVSARVRHIVELPPGALPTSVVEVCCYLNTEGRQQYALRIGGDETHVHLVGMLEHAKWWVQTQHAAAPE